MECAPPIRSSANRVRLQGSRQQPHTHAHTHTHTHTHTYTHTHTHTQQVEEVPEGGMQWNAHHPSGALPIGSSSRLKAAATHTRTHARTHALLLAPHISFLSAEHMDCSISRAPGSGRGVQCISNAFGSKGDGCRSAQQCACISDASGRLLRHSAAHPAGAGWLAVCLGCCRAAPCFWLKG